MLGRESGGKQMPVECMFVGVRVELLLNIQGARRQAAPAELQLKLRDGLRAEVADRERAPVEEEIVVVFLIKEQDEARLGQPAQLLGTGDQAEPGQKRRQPNPAGEQPAGAGIAMDRAHAEKRMRKAVAAGQ